MDQTGDMSFGFEEGDYTDSQRNRNRATIVGLGVAAIAVCVALGASSVWTARNAIGMSGVTVVVALCLWWMFGSRRAGPVGLSASSRSWFSSLARPWRQRK